MQEYFGVRHQLKVLQAPAQSQGCYRELLAGLSRVLTRARWRAFLVRPETLLRWHQGGVPPTVEEVEGTPASGTTASSSGDG